MIFDRALSNVFKYFEDYLKQQRVMTELYGSGARHHSSPLEGRTAPS